MHHYRHHCKVHNIKLHKPDTHHICNRQCHFHEVIHTMRNGNKVHLFVCKSSVRVHTCGDVCDKVETLPQNEGYVCALTRRVLQRQVLSDYTAKPSSEKISDGCTPPIKTMRKLSRTSSTAPKPVKMPNKIIGKRMRRQRKHTITQPTPSSNSMSDRSHSNLTKMIESTLIRVFRSNLRTTVYKNEMARFDAQIRPYLKHWHRELNIVNVDRWLDELASQRPHTLNPPPHKFTNILLKCLVHDLLNHFKKLRTLDATVMSEANVGIYTACMCTWMATGYRDIVQAVPFFSRHVPHPNSFVQLGIAPNKMSKFTRQFLRMVKLKGTTIHPCAIFTLSSGTIDALQHHIPPMTSHLLTRI